MREYTKNELVDLLDENDVYCPGKIDSVIMKSGKITHYLIEYIGWPTKDYPPEKVDASSSRIKPHKFAVTEYKAWVRHTPQMPMWPGKLYVRTPLEGSKEGLAYLEEFEKRVLVVPYGAKTKPMKPFCGGGWFKANKVRPITEQSDQRIQEIHESISGKNETAKARREELIAAFKVAWKELERDDETEVFNFAFCSGGSLEVNRAKPGSLTAREEKAKRKRLESGREQELQRLKYEKRRHIDLFAPPLPPDVAGGRGKVRKTDSIADNKNNNSNAEMIVRESFVNKEELLEPQNPLDINYFAKISALRTLLDGGVIKKNSESEDKSSSPYLVQTSPGGPQNIVRGIVENVDYIDL
jgi:hypothetical protein